MNKINNITIIVAMAKNMIIGKDNEMPWNIPEELASFKKITSGHNIVMGMNTYNSIGRLLPNRQSYIFSKDSNKTVEGAIMIRSFGEMMFHLLAKKNENFYVIGGRSIFEEFLSIAGKMIISEIDLTVEGDISFPRFDLSKWTLIKEVNIENSQNITIIQKHYEKVQFDKFK